MSEDLLTLLKYVFLALLFLFLWAVVRVVIRELRAPALVPTGRCDREERQNAPPKSFATLRVLAPESRHGDLVPIDNEITVGRGGGCALVLADDQYTSTVHARVF